MTIKCKNKPTVFTDTWWSKFLTRCNDARAAEKTEPEAWYLTFNKHEEVILLLLTDWL